jgi:hypothetical protein
MQKPVVMAFRKRLSKRGYERISIKRLIYGYDDVFVVTAVEPLSGSFVKAEYSIIRMDRSFR